MTEQKSKKKFSKSVKAAIIILLLLIFGGIGYVSRTGEPVEIKLIEKQIPSLAQIIKKKKVKKIFKIKQPKQKAKQVKKVISPAKKVQKVKPKPDDGLANVRAPTLEEFLKGQYLEHDVDKD